MAEASVETKYTRCLTSTETARLIRDGEMGWGQREYGGVVDVEVLLYVHRNRRLIMDGEPRTATSTFTQLLTSVAIWISK